MTLDGTQQSVKFVRKLSGGLGFFQRTVSTHSRHSGMDLSFPKPAIREV
jgi:hypothetical protein